MTTISFLPELLSKMFEQAEQTFPHEVCGILLGRELDHPPGAWRLVEQIRQVENAAENGRKSDRFSVDPAELLAAQHEADAAGLTILGFYHSHPNGRARPSVIDLENAWPVYSYVIVAVAGGRAIDVTSWILEAAENRFTEQTLVDATAVVAC